MEWVELHPWPRPPLEEDAVDLMRVWVRVQLWWVWFQSRKLHPPVEMQCLKMEKVCIIVCTECVSV